MKYELCLIQFHEEGIARRIQQIDKAEGDSLVEVLAKFLLVLNDIKTKEADKAKLERIMADDDIPF